MKQKLLPKDKKVLQDLKKASGKGFMKLFKKAIRGKK